MMLSGIRNRMLFVVLLLVMVVPVAAQGEGDDPIQDIVDYITENADDVAVYCSVGQDEDNTVTHNADEPFSLASTFKIVILAELARQIDNDMVDPETMVPLEDVNAYWLPGTDGGAQDQWLGTLDEGVEEVSLNDIAYGMIGFSSNANADFLLEYLGYQGFEDLYDLLELENTDLPTGTFLSLFLAQDNHETGMTLAEDFDEETLAEERERLQTLYLEDEAWREAQEVYVIQSSVDAISSEESAMAFYDGQAAFFDAYGPRGSARDMERVMLAAYESDVFGDEEQALMQDSLNWIMDVNPANRDVYSALGNKGGSLASIMTSAWFVRGDEDSPALQLAVFYRDVPAELWESWLMSGAHQSLELEAIAGGLGCDRFEDLFE